MLRVFTIPLWSALVLAVAGLATPAVGAQGAPSSAIAHYELTHDGRAERLDVMRTVDRVEHRYLTRGITEVWTRAPSGELEHWKVFQKAQRAVHYTAGDLRTIEAEPSWERLSMLISATERAKLKAKGTKRSGVRRATVLEGQLEQQPARVVWSEPTGWAQELALGAGHHQRKYRLLSVEVCAPATCAPIDMSGVREIEFADLGDMESDPFVRTFLVTFAGHAHARSR